MSSNREPHPILRAPVIGAILLSSLFAGVEAVAEPHSGAPSAPEKLQTILGQMEAAARKRDALQQRVALLFHQLELTSGAIAGVRADIESTRNRMATVTHLFQAQQSKLNGRARAIYMSPPMDGIDSLLGMTSLTDLQDALEFLGSASREDHDLIVSLSNRRTELERHRTDLERLRAKLTGVLTRLHQASAELVRKVAKQRALLRLLDKDRAEAEALIRRLSTGGREAARERINRLDTPDPPLPPEPEAVMDLIRNYFASLGSRTVEVALCVAEAESGFDPLAVNPATGASGVFQFEPSTWASLSEQAGWSGDSVFDARANVAVASWTVARYGWSAWGRVADACGA